MDFGKRYGYTFEHEATYERMCLVNKAVYIAKYATTEQCEKLYGYVPGDCNDHGGEWTATGTQFAVPYVFKTLFSKEDVVFEDLCETFSVAKGDLYLDFNEKLPDVSRLEKERDKLIKNTLPTDCIDKEIADGHDLHFVGRVGQFTPVKDGVGGGVLYRVNDGKLYNASGASNYRWLESEIVKNASMYDNICKKFYIELVDDAIDTINKYGDFEWFVSDAPYAESRHDGQLLAPVEFTDDGLPWDIGDQGEDVPFL